MIDLKTGKLFSKPLIFAGYILMLLGLLSIVSILGIILLLIGILISFGTTGVSIDPTGKRLKEYSRVFGYKWGEWKSYKDYPFIAVLRRKESSTVYSRSQVSTTELNTYFDINLMNVSHRKKVILTRLKGVDEAEKKAKELCELLEVEYTKYNPVISAKTRARRRR